MDTCSLNLASQITLRKTQELSLVLVTES